MARSRSLTAGAGIAAGTPFTVGTIPKVSVAGSNPALNDSVITQGTAGVGTVIRINNAAFPAATEQLQVLGGAIFDTTGSTVASPHDNVLLGRNAVARAALNANNVVIGTGASSNAGVASLLNTVVGAGAVIGVDQGGSVMIASNGGFNWTQTAGPAVLIGSGAAAIQFPGVAIGIAITVLGSGVAIGNQCTTAAVNNYVCVGRSSQATADSATAIGDAARGAHTASIALGRNAVTTQANQLLIGAQNLAINQVLIGEGLLSAGAFAGLEIRASDTQGTNTATGNMTIRSSMGTGNAATGGDIVFQTGLRVASGFNGQTPTTIMVLSGGTPNIALFGAGSYGSGEGVLFIKNATTAPTTNPTGGGILYVSAGALNYRGSGGTVTPLAAA